MCPLLELQKTKGGLFKHSGLSPDEKHLNVSLQSRITQLPKKVAQKPRVQGALKKHWSIDEKEKHNGSL